MSHTEGRLEAVTDCPGRCCWHIQKVGNTDEFNRITSLEMGEADARRLVACWNEHDGLVHDNARLYQSLQGEMQGRLKAEQERGEALAALEIICDLASMEWQEPDGSRKGAVDNWGERLYFVSKELIEGARAILAKHRVNHDQE